MKLANIANKGNTQLATDAYGSATFYCQFEPLSYSKVDGVAVRKRLISAAPSVTIPARGAISLDGQIYLVGIGAPDYWKGACIRKNYVLQGADALANLNTIAAELAGTAATSAYAALVFAKYLPDSVDSSKYPPQYQIFTAGSESAPAESLIQLNSIWYLVKDSYVSTSGLRIALANVIQGTVFETITASNKTYVPTTDSYTSVTHSVKLLRLRWQEHFTYLSKAQISYDRGDEQIFILKSAMTVLAGDTLALSDGTWRILDVQDEGLCWGCHARR